MRIFQFIFALGPEISKQACVYLFNCVILDSFFASSARHSYSASSHILRCTEEMKHAQTVWEIHYTRPLTWLQSLRHCHSNKCLIFLCYLQQSNGYHSCFMLGRFQVKFRLAGQLSFQKFVTFFSITHPIT